MKILNLKGVEVQLLGNQAFLYTDDDSNVLNIEGIEFAENAEEIIIGELEQINRVVFNNSSWEF